MNTPVDIDTLEKLLKEASPGPWQSLRQGNQYVDTSYMPTAKVVAASRVDGITRPWNPHSLLAFGFRSDEYETCRFLDADADFIAAIRNAAPALLAELRMLREKE